MYVCECVCVCGGGGGGGGEGGENWTQHKNTHFLKNTYIIGIKKEQKQPNLRFKYIECVRKWQNQGSIQQHHKAKYGTKFIGWIQVGVYEWLQRANICKKTC